MSKQKHKDDVRYKDAEWLHSKYVVEELTQQEIADLCGENHHRIGRWLRGYEIPTQEAGFKSGS